MLTLIHNIAELVVVPPGPVEGARMGAPQRVRQAAVQISGDHIAWFGPAADAPPFQANVVMDAGGGTVVPGLVDCHTHTLFAGAREGEFVQRIAGAT